MANNLLVLPSEHTKEDQAIWREAIRRGWKTLRLDPNKPEKIEGYDMVRYYGNVLHKTRVEKLLPIKFHPISPTLLSDLDISWTGREIKSMEFGELPKPLDKDTFIKCVDIKWLEARVYKAGEKPSSQWQGMQDHDKILVQEPVSFIDEVRCFVLDREILTMSYYRKNKEFCPENIALTPFEDIKDDAEPVWVRMLVDMLMAPHMYPLTKLPNGVVLDFGRLGYFDSGKLGVGRWALIEANEAWASGLYDCDPEKVFDTIIASQEDIK